MVGIPVETPAANPDAFAALRAALGVTVSATAPPFNATGDGVTDDFAALQAFFDYLATTGGHGIIPHGVYLVSDNPKFQDVDPPYPITVDNYGTIKATAITAAGSVILVRNTVDLTFNNWGVIDGGGAEGVLGNNGISASGLLIYGSQATQRLRVRPGTVKNCRMHPFLRGGKAGSFQSGVVDSEFKDGWAVDCDQGFTFEATVSDVDRYCARNKGINLNVAGARYGGILLQESTGPADDPDKSSVTLRDILLTDCGGEGLGVTFSTGDVDTATDIITITDHGFWSRDSVILTGASLPTGVSASTNYGVARVDADRLMITTSASAAANVPHTNISTSSNQVSLTGHQFLSGAKVVYICPTGFTGTNVPDSTAPGGLTHLDVKYAVRSGPNFFKLANNSTSVKTFGPSDINTGTGVITKVAHGLSTQDAVVVSIGSASTSLVTNPQLSFVLQAGSAWAGTTVAVGTTTASNNDQYNPNTTYYVNALSVDTFALYRTSADALADTNRIEIPIAGTGTLGVCLVSEIVDFTSQGSGYQTFASPRDLTTTGSGTIFIAGFSPFMVDRNCYVDAEITVRNSAASGATTIMRGRLLHSNIRFPNCILHSGAYIWDSATSGTRGEYGDPGTTASINVNLTAHVTYRRELATLSATATSGSAVLSGLTRAQMARFKLGDFVNASANFPSTTANYEILAVSTADLTITLDTLATGSGAATATLAPFTSQGARASALPGLVRASSTLGTDIRSCSIDLDVAGYPIGEVLVADIYAGINLRARRAETNEVLFMRSDDVANFTDANKFSATRSVQFHSQNIAIGNLFFSDDGSTYSTIRGVASRTPAIADGVGTRVARFTTAGLMTESSAFNGRHLLIGANHLWYDSGKLYTKASQPASATDGTVVGTQT